MRIRRRREWTKPADGGMGTRGQVKEEVWKRSFFLHNRRVRRTARMQFNFERKGEKLRRLI